MKSNPVFFSCLTCDAKVLTDPVLKRRHTRRLENAKSDNAGSPGAAGFGSINLIFLMTDPWDERYIYLHENHRNQPNVGQ